MRADLLHEHAERFLSIEWWSANRLSLFAFGVGAGSDVAQIPWGAIVGGVFALAVQILKYALEGRRGRVEERITAAGKQATADAATIKSQGEEIEAGHLREVALQMLRPRPSDGTKGIE